MSGGRPATEGSGQPAHGRATLAETFRAVAWSFFGVRRRADLERDMHRLHPAQVIGVGLVAAALFVAALVLLVRWVVGSGVAAG